MSAGIYNIGVERGTTKVVSLTINSGGSALNLTGYSATFVVKKSPEETAILTLTSASGIALGGALGTVVITISAASTGALQKSLNASYELDLTSGGGTVTRYLKGDFRIL